MSGQLDMHHKRKTTTALLSPPKRTETKTNTVTAGWTGGGSRHIWVGKKGAELNFTGFADSRKGGGNAMGKGGGSGERERDILTFTYRRQAEQSRGRQSKRYEQFVVGVVVQMPVCSICFSP